MPYITVAQIQMPYITVAQIQMPYITDEQILMSYITVTQLLTSYITVAQLLTSYITVAQLLTSHITVAQIPMSYFTCYLRAPDLLQTTSVKKQNLAMALLSTFSQFLVGHIQHESTACLGIVPLLLDIIHLVT